MGGRAKLADTVSESRPAGYLTQKILVNAGRRQSQMVLRSRIKRDHYARRISAAPIDHRHTSMNTRLCRMFVFPGLLILGSCVASLGANPNQGTLNPGSTTALRWVGDAIGAPSATSESHLPGWNQLRRVHDSTSLATRPIMPANSS